MRENRGRHDSRSDDSGWRQFPRRDRGSEVALKRRSLLAVTSELPWPLDSGGHLRTFHLLRELASRMRVRLVAGLSQADDSAVAGVTAAGIDVTPAVVGDRRPWREALRALKAAAVAEPYVFYRRHDRRAIWDAIRHEIQQQPPDVLYLDHLDSMRFVELAGSATVVADLHNVYSLLAERTAAEHSSGIAARYLQREARLLDAIERRAAGRADLLMTVSDLEARHFRSIGARRVVVVPNGVDTREYAQLPVGRETAAHPVVLFLGSLSWAPNASAVQFLATTALPEVRRHFPTAVLRIVGRGRSPAVEALRQLPGVELVGAVADVRPSLEGANVLAVPLEAGGGTRLKILEAFAAGLPVVSTPIGAEGIAAEHGKHLVIAPRTEFGTAIAGLLERPAAGLALAHEAKRLAEHVYDWSGVGRQAAEAIEELF